MSLRKRDVYKRQCISFREGGMRVRRAFLLLAFGLALWSAVLAHEALPVSAPSAAPQKKWILIELDMKRLTLYQGTTVLLSLIHI